MYLTYVAFALLFKLRLDEVLISSSTDVSDTGFGTVAAVARAARKRVSALEHSMSQTFLTSKVTLIKHCLIESVMLQIPIETWGSDSASGSKRLAHSVCSANSGSGCAYFQSGLRKAVRKWDGKVGIHLWCLRCCLSAQAEKRGVKKRVEVLGGSGV